MTMRTVPALAAFGLIAGTVLLAQSGGTQSETPAVIETAAISGVVIDAATKEPLGDALVYLSNDFRPATTQSRQLTDAKGRFAFPNLAARAGYTLRVSKSGYLDGEYGRDPVVGTPGHSMTLRENEWVADARVSLWRPNVISGVVVDERGEPVVGVYVRLIGTTRATGREYLAAGPMMLTDDRGTYRFAGLTPGRYFVHVPSVHTTVPVVPVPASTAPGSGPATSAPSRPQSGALSTDGRANLLVERFPIARSTGPGQTVAYPMMFYPGATTLTAATPIVLKVAEERSNVDITIAPVPVWRVSGIVEGPLEALRDVALRLVPTGMEMLGRGAEIATSGIDAEGRFTFLNVPSGSYVIDAPRTFTEFSTTGHLPMNSISFPGPAGRGAVSFSSNSVPGNWATSTTMLTALNYNPSRDPGVPFVGRASITVGNQHEQGVVLKLHPTGTLSGRIVAESSPGSSGPAPSAPSAMSIRLESANGDPSLGMLNPALPPNAGSEFTIQGLRPGGYVLRGPSSPWMVKSVTWKGRDFTDSPFDAAETQDFSGVEVTLTAALPVLSGNVRDRQGAPAAGAAILLYPADSKLWTMHGFTPTRLRLGRAANNGSYRLTAFPAGEYQIVAVESAQSQGWNDPEFLQKASGLATRVAIGWGETRTVDLDVQTIR